MKILRSCDKVQKSLVVAFNRYKKKEEERKIRFFYQKMAQKNTPAVSVGIQATLNQN